MTERSVYSLIDQIIRDGKRRINARDREIIDQLLGSYQEARNTVTAELMLLDDQIQWAIANSEGELTEAWLRRQAFYQRLEATIEREAARLEDTTRTLTIQGQLAGIAEGGASGTATVRAIPWLGMNPAPVEHWTAAIQPGSPLDKVLTRYGQNTEASLKRGITQGLIEGKGSKNITREIITEVGEFIPPSDASRIVRTETMRAYRGVYHDQMEALPQGMVVGYRWVSALGMRTCEICIGLHGQIFPEYPNYFHVNCRCTVHPVFSERYAPLRRMQTGEQWLRNQPPETQVKVMGNGKRYEAWRDGMPLNQMIRLESDPVWGGSSRLIPVRDLVP